MHLLTNAQNSNYIIAVQHPFIIPRTLTEYHVVSEFLFTHYMVLWRISQQAMWLHQQGFAVQILAVQ